MKKIIPKNKILLKLKSNIWNNFKIKKLKSKKWRFFVKNLIFYKKTFEYKPKNLKHLYKQRLLEKQKLKSFYGFLSEKKLKIIKNLILKKNNISKLNIFLEKKLYILLYRLNVTSSIFEAKQLIRHKKIKINNKIVTYPDYTLKKGDIVKFTSKNLNKKNINILPYIEYEKNFNMFIFLRNPKISEIKYPFKYNPTLISEILNKY